MNPRPVMISPDEAAKLLANNAAPGTDPARERAALQAIREMCDTAVTAHTQLNPAAVAYVLDTTEVQLISSATYGAPEVVPMLLDEALALVQAAGTEIAWEPHPYLSATHCLLVVSRIPSRSDRAVWFGVPAPLPDSPST